MEEILIIDDSRQIAELLSRDILPSYGYATRVAWTGSEGLNLLKQYNPDLILLDLQLPDTSGLDLMRYLAQHGSDTPVILMTAHGSEQVAVEAFRLGARNYLIKPFSEEEVITAIERALRERRLQCEKEQLHLNLQQRVRELTVLSAVGKSVTTLLDLELLLERIVEAGVYLTQADEGFLLLLDPQSNMLYLRAAKNLGEDRVRHFELPLTDSISGQVISSRRPVRLEKGAEHGTIKLKTGYLVRALLQVPLLVGNQAIGVLGVVNRQSSRSFDDNDQYLLSALADYAAIALHNARLFVQISTSEERYRDLFDHANDLIFTLDDQFKITSINHLTKQLLGYDAQQLLGSPLAGYCEHESWREREPQLHLLREGKEERCLFELVLRHCNGELRYTEVNARIIGDEGNQREIHCIARDVTERRRLEAQLIQSEKLSAIGQLVAGVAHELNNPLTSVTGYADLLLYRDDLEQEVQSDLRHIRTQAERAAYIVQNLLTFAREHSYQRIALDINTVLEDTLQLQEYHLQVENIQIVRELDPRLPLTSADPYQLQQVFLNLITNASQAMAAKGGGALTVRTWQASGEVQASISDTGVGMPQDMIARIFDPFYTTKPIGQGTGLGLSLCYGIISQYGGRIWAESLPDQGSTFYVVLPVHLKPAEAETALDPDLEVEASDLNVLPRSSVLVVDDEEAIGLLLGRMLSEIGHRATVVCSGAQALQMLDAHSFDVIMTDVKMPGMNGFELYKQIRERSAALAQRVVFTTGDTVSPATRGVLAQLGNRYLAKPFSREALEQLIGDVIRGSLVPANKQH